MKKTFVSMGLAAAGTAAFQITCAAQVLSSEAPKLWNVSASLNGFYDDNYATAPNAKGSFGLEFSPTVTATLPLTQTELGVLYTYDLMYYQERDQLNQNPVDQSHSFNFWLDHSFNERWQAKLNESFVSGQEPELINNGSPGGSPYRLEGNNIANNASMELDTEWTRLFSTSLSYANGFFDYDNSGAQALSPAGAAPGYTGPGFEQIYTDGIETASYAGELNRDENTVALDLQWHLAPETMVFVGYSFEIVNYTANEPIGVYNYNKNGYYASPIGPTLLPNGAIINVNGTPTTILNTSEVYNSSTRDNLSHFGYVGVQHNILPNLVASGKVGIQYNDAYNNPDQSVTGLDPYANVSLIYTYLPGCNAQIGFSQMRNSTDVAYVDQSNGSITQDQESSSLHASINHRVTQKLLVSVIGAWSSSTFNGGSVNNDTDTDYGLGFSANYSFTRNFSGNINYNYDNLSSSIDGRQYVRNRISIGVSVAY